MEKKKSRLQQACVWSFVFRLAKKKKKGRPGVMMRSGKLFRQNKKYFPGNQTELFRRSGASPRAFLAHALT